MVSVHLTQVFANEIIQQIKEKNIHSFECEIRLALMIVPIEFQLKIQMRDRMKS